MIFPLRIWLMVMPLKETFLFVGGTPRNSRDAFR